MSLPSADQGSWTGGVASLEIARIRRDGDTQGRSGIRECIVEEYADLIACGVMFPPVRVWFDGESLWLSDGFHRLAAAERNGLVVFTAEIRTGTLADAKWDSYCANAAHGVRRTRADLVAVISRALQHPNTATISNRELARYLSVPEATLRRYRNCVSASNDADTVRIAVRNGKCYAMDTGNIGAGQRNRTLASHSDLRKEFRIMKGLASSQALPILSVVGDWLFGKTSSIVCMERIESLVEEFQNACKANTSTGMMARGA